MDTTAGWQQLALRGDKVAAIKELRVTADVTLDAAKAAVEQWLASADPPSTDMQACLDICERVQTRLAAYLSANPRPFSHVIHVSTRHWPEPDWVRDVYVMSVHVDRPRCDLVVEVAEPGFPSRARRETIKGHIASGVRMVWFIESDDCTIRVATQPTPWHVFHDDAIFDGVDVLPGFSCKVADLFR